MVLRYWKAGHTITKEWIQVCGDTWRWIDEKVVWISWLFTPVPVQVHGTKSPTYNQLMHRSMQSPCFTVWSSLIWVYTEILKKVYHDQISFHRIILKWAIVQVIISVHTFFFSYDLTDPIPYLIRASYQNQHIHLPKKVGIIIEETKIKTRAPLKSSGSLNHRKPY